MGAYFLRPMSDTWKETATHVRSVLGAEAVESLIAEAYADIAAGRIHDFEQQDQSEEQHNGIFV